MNEIDNDEMDRRLARCFQAVFPDLANDAVPGASTATIATWDSIASITLMNVVQDEFGLEVDLDELAELDSFERYHSYLRGRLQMAR